jgi:hypothetical protein
MFRDRRAGQQSRDCNRLQGRSALTPLLMFKNASSQPSSKRVGRGVDSPDKEKSGWAEVESSRTVVE